MLSYTRSESVVSRVIAGETLIIPIRKGVGDLAAIYSLNGVASLIWTALGQPNSREEIVRIVEKEFAAESGQVESDVQGFLDEMCSLGLVHPSAAGAVA